MTPLAHAPSALDQAIEVRGDNDPDLSACTETGQSMMRRGRLDRLTERLLRFEVPEGLLAERSESQPRTPASLLLDADRLMGFR
jgi:hypothetical protein